MVFLRGKRPHCDYGCKVIMLDGFDLGVFGELGARRFRGGKGFAQRAQRAQRLGKGIAEMFIDYVGWRAGGVAGVPGSVSPATTDGGAGGGLREVRVGEIDD